MKKRMKKLTAILLAFVLTLSFAATVFAAEKTTDTVVKDTSEFGTLIGKTWYGGKDLGRKIVNYVTSILHLSDKGVTTRIYASVEIRDYDTGVYRDKDQAQVKTNECLNSYYWEGHDDIVNNRKISAYATCEVRGQSGFAAYPSIYGF